MCTRSGTSFHPPSPPPTEAMDQLRADIGALTQSMTQLSNQLTNRCDQIEARLGPIEQAARLRDRFQRAPAYRRPEPFRNQSRIPGSTQGYSQAYPSRPSPNRSDPSRPSLARPSPSRPSLNRHQYSREDKGKAIEVQRRPDPQGNSYRCHKPEHFASQCTAPALLMDEPTETEPEPIVEPEEDLKVEPIENLGKETPEPIKELKESIYESSLVEDGPEGEIIEESKENDPEPTTKFEEEMTEPGSHLVNEHEDSPVFSTGVQEPTLNEPIQREHPQEMVEARKEIEDEVPDELPDQLPPLRDIHHTIDLVPGSSLTDLPHCGIDPSEPQDLPEQVDHMTPIEQCPNFKVILNNQGLFYVFHKPPQDSDSYFLPFPEPSHISKAMGLLFIEITRMRDSLEPIPFALYFWYTLWHLLGILNNFSCAYQTRDKPRESIIC